jgi:hypothetical protein
MMKINAFLAIILSAVLITTSGCITTGKPGSGFDSDKAAKAAIVLKSTARSAVYYAHSKDTNALTYVNLAIAVVDKFLTQDDLSPTALTDAMREIPVRELKSVEAQLAINTIEMTYEIFWGDYLRSHLSGNEPLMIALSGLRDGLILGQQDIAGH